MVSAVNKTKLGQRVLDLGGGAAGDRTGAFVQISDNEGMRATYGTFIGGYAPPATPTDILTIRGTASKLVRIKGIYMSGTATAAANIQIKLIRRSAANTGGTSASAGAVPHDVSDDASAAVTALYSVLPTGLGTAVGTVHGGRLNLAPAANGSIDRLWLDFGWRNEKGIILSGTTDILALNLGGAAWPAGGLLDIDLCWSEETIETVL